MDREYYESRRDAMVALYRDGATLEEVGNVYHVTRERVRQVINRAVKRGKGLDPIKTIQVCRRAPSLSAAADELGSNNNEVKTLLKETGHWPTMHRLWEWRKRQCEHRYTDQELISALQGFAVRLGYTPGHIDLCAAASMPATTTYQKHFGSLQGAQIAAGLKPVKVGGRRAALKATES